MEKLTRDRNWEARLQHEAAVLAWPTVAGEELSRHTVATGVRNGILHVAVRSGTWATQLSFFRTDLLKRLRDKGLLSVREIVFRVGLPPDVRETPHPTWPDKHSLPATPEVRAVAARLSAEAGGDELGLRLARLYLAAVARRRRLIDPDVQE